MFCQVFCNMCTVFSFVGIGFPPVLFAHTLVSEQKICCIVKCADAEWSQGRQLFILVYECTVNWGGDNIRQPSTVQGSTAPESFPLQYAHRNSL